MKKYKALLVVLGLTGHMFAAQEQVVPAPGDPVNAAAESDEQLPRCYVRTGKWLAPKVKELWNVFASYRNKFTNFLAQDAGANVADVLGSVLHYACSKGDCDLVKLLLDKGASVDAQNEEGRTPLHIATSKAGKGDKEICELLLDRNASVDARDSQGDTPLHLAAANGYKEVCELLLNRNAPVDARESHGATPLHLAAANGCKEVCELLVGRNAAVDARLNRDFVYDGMVLGEFTPLHLAVDGNKLEVVKVLLQAGADKYARTQDDRTALNIARQRGHSKLVAYLESVY